MAMASPIPRAPPVTTATWRSSTLTSLKSLGNWLAGEKVQRRLQEPEVFGRAKVIGARQRQQPAVGKCGYQPVSGPGEVALAEYDQDRHADGGYVGFGQRRSRPAQARGQRSAVIARRQGEMRQRGDGGITARRSFTCLDSVRGHIRPGVGEDVVASAADDDPAEPLRLGGGRAQQQLSAHTESNSIGLAIRE